METPAPESDRTLVVRMKANDEEVAAQAFEQIAERYYVAMLSYLTYSTGSRDTAEDLVQDIFLRLWRNRATLDVTASLKVYLYTAARNQLRNYVRGRHRSEAYTAAYVQAMQNEGSADSPDDQHEALIAAAQQAVQTLPPRAREIWTLHREQGLSYAEVAEVLSVSINTVKTQMGRALRTVRLAAAPFLALLLVSRG